MPLLLMAVDEGLTVAVVLHRRTERQRLRITVEAEAAGVAVGRVVDTPAAEVVDTIAAAAVDTPVAADTPVVIAKKQLMVGENAARIRAAFLYR